MNAIYIARKRRIALTLIALVGLYSGAGGAATVRSSSTDAMDHSYGRAGGLTGSEVVSEPHAWQQGGPPVQVGYSELVADWTNMPRDEAHEGPVTDSYGPMTAQQHASISAQRQQ